MFGTFSGSYDHRAGSAVDVNESIAVKKVTRFRFVDVVFAFEQTKEKSMFNVKIFSVTSNRTIFGRRALIFKMIAN